MKKTVLVMLAALMAQVLQAGGASDRDFLIVYGSFRDSTKETAERIKMVLEKKKYTVDIMAAADKKMDLSGYGKVVIGSAIHGGKLHPGVPLFVSANEKALKDKKTAVFILCMTITSSSKKWRDAASRYPELVALPAVPYKTAVFAGITPDSGAFANFIMGLFLKVKPGDHRDWAKIEEWAGGL